MVVNCWHKVGVLFLPLKCFSVNLYEEICVLHILGAQEMC